MNSLDSINQELDSLTSGKNHLITNVAEVAEVAEVADKVSSDKNPLITNITDKETEANEISENFLELMDYIEKKNSFKSISDTNTDILKKQHKSFRCDFTKRHTGNALIDKLETIISQSINIINIMEKTEQLNIAKPSGFNKIEEWISIISNALNGEKYDDLLEKSAYISIVEMNNNILNTEIDGFLNEIKELQTKCDALIKENRLAKVCCITNHAAAESLFYIFEKYIRTNPEYDITLDKLLDSRLGLSILHDNKISTKDLACMHSHEISRLKGIGPKALENIKDGFANHGLEALCLLEPTIKYMKLKTNPSCLNTEGNYYSPCKDVYVLNNFLSNNEFTWLLPTYFYGKAHCVKYNNIDYGRSEELISTPFDYKKAIGLLYDLGDISNYTLSNNDKFINQSLSTVISTEQNKDKDKEQS